MFSDRGTVGGLAQRVACRHAYALGSRKGCLVLYGRGGDQDSWFTYDDSGREIRDITDRDIPVASCATGVLWGNSTQRTNMSTLKTNAQTSLFAAGKVHLMGASAGGLAALNWAKNNPTLVQSISLVIPVIDVQYVHTNNIGGFASEINTAYGGAPADADCPAKYAANLAGIPIKIWYSTDDTYTLAATTTTFASASGATAVSMGAIAHSWTTPGLGISIGNFIREND